jgi:hypothetical protein
MPSLVFDYYSVDAGIMIRLKDMLPYDLFEPAWNEIARLVSADRWKIFENVVDDIHGRTVQQWLAENSTAIVRFDSTINDYITALMADLQRNNMLIIDPASLRNNTDPFVIMLALYLEKRPVNNLRRKGSKTCCVLTREEPKMNKINIPYVCEYYDIPYMTLYDFMRHHGWRISLDVQNP